MLYRSMWYMISETRRSVITSKSANVSLCTHTYTHTHMLIFTHRHNIVFSAEYDCLWVCLLSTRQQQQLLLLLHSLNGLFSRTTWVSRHQKSRTILVKPIWILLKQETASGSGISWAICKSAPRPRQITMPESHCSVFTGLMPFLPPTNSVKALKAKALYANCQKG